MGTKSKPGKFDCMAAAEDDEPLFTLVARDPTAPYFVNLWSAIRCGDVPQAYAWLAALIDREADRYPKPGDAPKIDEARQCAVDMVHWRQQHRASDARGFGHYASYAVGRRRMLLLQLFLYTVLFVAGLIIGAKLLHTPLC